MKDNAGYGPEVVTYSDVDQLRAGIDWISCSLAADAPGLWTWANDCVTVLNEIADEGHRIGNFGILGYKGIKAGGSFTGHRDSGCYLQLAGAYADRYYRRIARPDLHISRLDLAVTVQYRIMPRELGENAYRAATKADENLSLGRSRAIWYMSGSDGGYTLYIGSPKSEQRGRLYNKEVQSDTPEYARCWRFETVYRNARAMALFESICAVDASYAPLLICNLVGDWYQDRGVRCEWTTTHRERVQPILKVPSSDAAKKLKWLQTQVKPAILWLIEHGYDDEMWSALGMYSKPWNVY